MKILNKKGKVKYIDSTERRRKGFPFDLIKLGIFLAVLIVVAILFTVSGFDVTLHCTRSTSNICEIKKSSVLDPVPVELGRFSLDDVKEINVTNRIVENSKSVYDIELDRGEIKGRQFIDFAFNTIIKANTAKMKLLRYYEDFSRPEIVINKHCYFNDYFCF